MADSLVDQVLELWNAGVITDGLAAIAWSLILGCFQPVAFLSTHRQLTGVNRSGFSH